MSARPDFDRTLTAWLDAQAPTRAPGGLAERVAVELAATRRLPGWAVLERWLPMQTTARLGPTARAAIIMAILGLLLATLAAIGVGSQPDREPAPPFGLARNGLIAFDPGGDIWVADADGGDRRFFVSGPGFDIDPTFSPDGTKLAFWSIEVGDDSAIVLEDASTGTVKQLLIAGTASLMVSDMDGTAASEPRALVSGLQLHHDGHPPSWSPTSDALVYGHLVDPEDVEDRSAMVIDTIALEGGQPRRVTSGDSPSWSPDGRRLAYRSATTPWSLMVAGIDGSDPRQASTSTSGWHAIARPQWSPDSEAVAFSFGQAADVEADIKIATLDGSVADIVPDPAFDDNYPHWSPDGTRLAFQRGWPNVHLVVADALDGWALTELASEPLAHSAPVVWSPDGTRLIGFPLDVASTGGFGSPDGIAPIAILDASGPGGVEPVIIDASSPWFSASWQRLAP
jgi:TolB protein